MIRRSKLDKRINKLDNPSSTVLSDGGLWQNTSITTVLNKSKRRQFIDLDSNLSDRDSAFKAYLKVSHYIESVKFRVSKGDGSASADDKREALRAALKVIAGCSHSGQCSSRDRNWVLFASPDYTDRWISDAGFGLLTRQERRTIHKHAMLAVEASGLARVTGKRDADKRRTLSSTGKAVIDAGGRLRADVVSRLKFKGDACGIRIERGSEESLLAALGEASRGAYITASSSSDEDELQHGVWISVPTRALSKVGSVFEVNGISFSVSYNKKLKGVIAENEDTGMILKLVSSESPQDGVAKMRLKQVSGGIRVSNVNYVDSRYVPDSQVGPASRSLAILKLLKKFVGVAGLVTEGKDTIASRSLTGGVGIVSHLSSLAAGPKRTYFTAGDGVVRNYDWSSTPFFTSEKDLIGNGDVRKTQDLYIKHVKGSARDVLRMSSYVYFRARSFERISDRLSGLGEGPDTTALDEYNRANPDAQITSITLHTNGMVACKLSPACVSDTHVGGPSVKSMVSGVLGEQLYDNLDKASNFVLRVPQEGALHVLADLDSGILNFIKHRSFPGCFFTHSGNFVRGQEGRNAVWGTRGITTARPGEIGPCQM